MSGNDFAVIPVERERALATLAASGILALGDRAPLLIPSINELLSTLDLTGASDPVMQAAAKLHVLMAGPGPQALDRRPGSAEIIHNPELWLKAQAEAKARELRAMAGPKPSPADVAAAAEYDARKEAHEWDIINAAKNARLQGRIDATEEFEKLSLWTIIKERIDFALFVNYRWYRKLKAAIHRKTAGKLADDGKDASWEQSKDMDCQMVRRSNGEMVKLVAVDFSDGKDVDAPRDPSYDFGRVYKTPSQEKPRG